MPVDPHIGSDWDSAADTDPIAATKALRRDVHRLKQRVAALEKGTIDLIIEEPEQPHADP